MRIENFNKAEINRNLQDKVGLSYKELVETIGNKYWGLVIFICYLPRGFYLGVLIRFLQADAIKQGMYDARYTIVEGLNAAAISLVLSSIAGTVIAIVVNVTSSSFIPRLVTDVLFLLFVIWWRKTYLDWANSKA